MRQYASFVRQYASFMRQYASFVRHYASFVRHYASFVRQMRRIHMPHVCARIHQNALFMCGHSFMCMSSLVHFFDMIFHAHMFYTSVCTFAYAQKKEITLSF